jgi:hypothetical protein
MFDDPQDMERMLQVALIDKRSQRMIRSKLVDENGDEIEINEVARKLTEYVTDQCDLGGDDNATLNQVIPLMGQAMTAGCYQLMGNKWATLLLSQEHVRMSIVYMMTVSFYLLKWLQKQKVRIHTEYEELSPEDIEHYEKIVKTGDAIQTVAALGGDPEEMLKHLLKEGQISQEDYDNIMRKRDSGKKQESN